ncbi:hypothetical protein CBR_g25764 [Chara braunii]|uniref:Uncharacterized protein n=1 Tax=Chara braunii TaxID=69332 RepID=A0A388L6C0_CHABU|nr:hypothetical protein CBR_g25764 [Chara braunii]|eukprot:GBG77834.1 hypothetical protein CBR_g25764 [Chara braunii]
MANGVFDDRREYWDSEAGPGRWHWDNGIDRRAGWSATGVQTPPHTLGVTSAAHRVCTGGLGWDNDEDKEGKEWDHFCSISDDGEQSRRVGGGGFTTKGAAVSLAVAAVESIVGEGRIGGFAPDGGKWKGVGSSWEPRGMSADGGWLPALGRAAAAAGWGACGESGDNGGGEGSARRLQYRWDGAAEAVSRSASCGDKLDLTEVLTRTPGMGSGSLPPPHALSRRLPHSPPACPSSLSLASLWSWITARGGSAADGIGIGVGPIPRDSSALLSGSSSSSWLLECIKRNGIATALGGLSAAASAGGKSGGGWWDRVGGGGGGIEGGGGGGGGWIDGGGGVRMIKKMKKKPPKPPGIPLPPPRRPVAAAGGGGGADGAIGIGGIGGGVGGISGFPPVLREPPHGLMMMPQQRRRGRGDRAAGGLIGVRERKPLVPHERANLVLGTILGLCFAVLMLFQVFYVQTNGERKHRLDAGGLNSDSLGL